MRAFEESVVAELAWLVRAGVPSRGVRLSVRDLMARRMERGPLGAREIGEAMEEAVRAACRLVHESHAPDEIVDIVCGAALDAVRGHGGRSAQWLEQATAAAQAVLDEVTDERSREAIGRRLAWRVWRW